eukprot:2851544-Amphidinium_carterae.2
MSSASGVDPAPDDSDAEDAGIQAALHVLRSRPRSRKEICAKARYAKLQKSKRVVPAAVKEKIDKHNLNVTRNSERTA